MAHVVARCARCGASYQRFDPSEEWDRRVGLAYCPACVDSEKPWEIQGVLLPSQPGWTRLEVTDNAPS